LTNYTTPTDAAIIFTPELKIEFDAGYTRSVQFLGPNADLASTHISIIAGANGTSKSRLLASVAEQLSFVRACQVDPRLTGSKLPTSHGLRCLNFSTVNNGQILNEEGQKDATGSTQSIIPTGILVLSNLVADKFHFPQSKDESEPYYLYLGARQGTNMMTSGSLERSVTEAILRIVAKDDYLNLYKDWLGLIFSGSAELAFGFPRLTRSTIDRYLAENDKKKFISKRLQQRSNRFRSIPSAELPVNETEAAVTALFNFLAPKLLPNFSSEKGRQSVELQMLHLGNLTGDEKTTLSKLPPLFALASRAGFSLWPSLNIGNGKWLQFNQLSSGEQNLLSIGAKLIAHAKPGCLIAIDEPEVSLNVGWQQRYIDLVQESLKFAKGCHVLIATHSPHIIASISEGKGSVILIEKQETGLSFSTKDAKFEGWGSESVLYKVLGIPSASSHLFNMELTRVLTHIQNDVASKDLIDDFLITAEKLSFDADDPIKEIIDDIEAYRRELQ
jgi:predicted ATPase